MTTLNEEFEYLSNSEKRIFAFKNKTKNLSKLKLSFFQKMEEAEFKKNPEKAQKYYNYLIRTTILSKKIYQKTLTEINEYQKYINNTQIINENEINESLKEYPQIKEIYFSLHISQQTFIIKIKELIFDLIQDKNNNNLILQIEKLIEIQKQHLIIFGTEKNQFFEELKLQNSIELELKNEEILSNLIIDKIEKLNKEILTFSEKMKIQAKIIKTISINIAKTIKDKPLSTLFMPANKAGIILEKNASLFAATIMTLSIIGKISLLLGQVEITAITEATILIMAEVGEGLQAIPFMKTLPGKFNQFVKDTCQNAMNSIRNIQIEEISLN
ncbi:MAG: hypothetical protein KC589_10065 [Nanoarchaeota archaeon]|nr:hypothetical protein [Nanoarchaeota archaeon]